MPSINGLRAPDKFLTNFSLTVAQDQSAFSVLDVIPTINVEQQQGLYRIFDSETLRKVQVRPVASGAQTTAGDFSYGQGQYNCQMRGLHVDIDPALRVNATDINIEKDTTTFLTSQMAVEKTKRFVDTFFAEGVWGTTKKGGTDFKAFDDASSDPVRVIQDSILQVQIASGFKPNTMWIAREAFNNLLLHPEIIDRINRGQTTGPAIANEQTLAAIFSLNKVIVIDAIVSDAEGKNAMLGKNKILLAYVNSNAGTQSATAMAHINWVGIGRYLTAGQSILKMNHPLVDGVVRLEIKYADHLVVTAPTLGVLLTDVMSK